MDFSRTIDLSAWREIGRGTTRIVFESDRYPSILLKVIRPEKRTETGGRISRKKHDFLRRWQRFGVYLSFKRESAEFIEQARRCPGKTEPEMPIARVHGFVHTTLGLGLIVERLRGPDGATAPTLGQLARHGRLCGEGIALLNACFRDMMRRHVVLGDCNLDNFVLSTDADGRNRVVCIDGTGDKSAIRIYAASRVINALKLVRYRGRLERSLEKLTLEAPTRPRQLRTPDAARARTPRRIGEPVLNQYRS